MQNSLTHEPTHWTDDDDDDDEEERSYQYGKRMTALKYKFSLSLHYLLEYALRCCCLMQFVIVCGMQKSEEKILFANFREFCSFRGFFPAMTIFLLPMIVITDDD